MREKWLRGHLERTFFFFFLLKEHFKMASLFVLSHSVQRSFEI